MQWHEVAKSKSQNKIMLRTRIFRCGHKWDVWGERYQVSVDVLVLFLLQCCFQKNPVRLHKIISPFSSRWQWKKIDRKYILLWAIVSCWQTKDAKRGIAGGLKFQSFCCLGYRVPTLQKGLSESTRWWQWRSPSSWTAITLYRKPQRAHAIFTTYMNESEIKKYVGLYLYINGETIHWAYLLFKMLLFFFPLNYQWIYSVVVSLLLNEPICLSLFLLSKKEKKSIIFFLDYLKVISRAI